MSSSLRWLVVESLRQVGALGGLQVVQPGPQSELVDPQLLGNLDGLAGPRERLAKGVQVDQAPGDSRLDRGLLTGRQDGIGRHRAPLDMLEFVGESAATLGLVEAEVKDDHPRVMVGQPEQIAGQAAPRDQPVAQPAQSSPRVVNRPHKRQC